MSVTQFPLYLRTVYQPDPATKSAFLAEVDAIANGGEKRLERFASDTQRILDQALKVPRNSLGALDLGTEQARAAAIATEGRAAAARELAAATRLAATSAGDYSQQARLATAAAEALAIDEERAAMAARAHAEAVGQLQAALNRQTGATDAAAAASVRATAANDNVTMATGAQRQGLQQLGYQLGDVATMYALGARPAQIFASQIGQITQAVQLMSGGTSRLAGFLGGPWGIAITTATIALSPFIGKLFDSSDAADKAADSFKSAADEARGLIGAMNALALNDKRIQLNKLTEERLGLENLVAKNPYATDPGYMGGWFQAPGGAKRRLAEIRQEELPLRNEISIADAENEKADAKAREREREKANKSRDHHRARAAGLSDAERATKRATEATETFITSLQDEIARLGLNAKQLRMLEVAKARDAAVTDAQKAKISELSAAREIAIKREEALAKIMERVRQAQTIGKADNDRLAALDREFALLGKVGPAREVAALELEKEAFMAEHAALGIQGATAAWEEYYQTSLRNIYEQSRLERDAEAAERARDAIAELAQSLSGLGGAGGIAGTLLNLTQGRFGNIGGPFGALLQTVNAIPMGRNPDGSTRYLADRIEAIFSGKGSPFGQTIAGLLQGGGIGIAAGSTVLGQRGNNAGSFIGGALGEAAFKKLAPKLFAKLGDFAGPIGSIVGGLLGGVLGSAFNKVKKGYAVVGQGGVTVGGNSADLMASSKTSGTGIQSAINAIAEQLGAQVGAYTVSIGKRSSGWIRVSASGSSKVADKSYNKGPDVLYNGKDEAEAMRIAILNALQDGAIKGVREGTQRLLKAGGDLETQLKKALDFESVFTRLKGYTDPVGAALDTLDREFERLKKVFGEAGATAAEYADLEKLYGLERAKAIKSALDQVAGSLRSFLDDLGIGDNGLSLRDRQAAAQAKYAPLAERVRAGDSTAFDDYAQASRDLLDITRQLYGSQSPYFDLMGQIRSEGQGALDKAQAAADLSAGRDSPFSNSPTANTSDNAAVVGAIDAQTEALLAGLGGRLDLLNSNLVTSLQMQAANSNDGGVLFGRIGNKSNF